MSVLQLRNGAVNPDYMGADGGFQTLRGMRDGSLVNTSSWEAAAAEGRVLSANIGSAATPVAFIQAYAANRPSAWLRVPSGVQAVPLEFWASFSAMVGTVTQVDVRVSESDIGNGTSTQATQGPFSNKVNAAVAVPSGCFVRYSATGDTSAEVNPRTLFRKTYIIANTQDGDKGILVTREMMGFPILIGPATLEVYMHATTTAPSGYAGFHWLEPAKATLLV